MDGLEVDLFQQELIIRLDQQLHAVIQAVECREMEDLEMCKLAG